MIKVRIEINGIIRLIIHDNYDLNIIYHFFVFFSGWTGSSFTTHASLSAGSRWRSATISKWDYNLWFSFFVGFLFQLTIILMFSPQQRRSLVTIAQTSPPWPPSMRWSMQQSNQVRPRETMALMIWVTVMWWQWWVKGIEIIWFSFIWRFDSDCRVFLYLRAGQCNHRWGWWGSERWG